MSNVSELTYLVIFIFKCYSNISTIKYISKHINTIMGNICFLNLKIIIFYFLTYPKLS